MKRSNLGKLMRDLRESKNLTQKALAKKLYTTQRRISYWETGISLPSIYELKQISVFFNISIDVFLE